MNLKAFQLETAMAIVLLSASSSVDAFAPRNLHQATLSSQTSNVPVTRRFASSFEPVVNDTNNEVERLREMAAKLRNEAASLEAEQRDAWAQAAEKAFGKFDTNKDGQISIQELQTGLEKAFKVELSENRVKQLMQAYDTNQDGFLQPQEFVGLDQMRNKIDSLAREERAAERADKKAAQEQLAAQAQLDEVLELINDKPPTAMDKAVSTIPYLFPLLDGLQFGGHLITQHADNPLATAAAIAFGLYRSIPFAGFMFFFALSFLSDNLAYNPLVRFNMRQAIYLDIALFVPSLLVSLASLVAGGQANIPPELLDQSSDVIFVTLLATLMYSAGSSLLGATPDKLPFISQAVQNQMVSADMAKDSLFGRQDDNGDQKKQD